MGLLFDRNQPLPVVKRAAEILANARDPDFVDDNYLHELCEKQAYPTPGMGIPSREDYGDFAKINPGDLLDLVVQDHQAERAGRHFDVRFGDSARGLYSFATRKGFPEPGGKPFGFYRQPLHSYSYGSYQGPLRGYGAGTVKTHDKGQIQVTKVSPGSIHFTRTDGETPQQYALVKPKSSKREHDWLIINTTKAPATPAPTTPVESTEVVPKEAAITGLPGGGSFLRRGIAGQLYNPIWDKSAPILQNILTNVHSALGRGQRLVDEQDNWRDFLAASSPMEGARQSIEYMNSGGADPVVSDPLDWSLFRMPRF